MKTRSLLPKDFLFLVPAALLPGAGLAALQPGSYWIGWLGFSALLLLGLAALLLAWRWACVSTAPRQGATPLPGLAARAGNATRTLAWMIALALLLRLAAGVAVYIALPIDGYAVPDDKAGFVFTDAHRRDDQAWELAASGKPLWAAFDKSFYTDQYGGLLALSALSYKIFSPDAHRPLSILLLAALTAALGVPFLYKAARLLWDPSPSLTVRAASNGGTPAVSPRRAPGPPVPATQVQANGVRDGRTGSRLATVSTWLFVLYPESVLTGGAQMREPFLLTFMAMCFWGFAEWLKGGERHGWGWLGIGILGMLLVSPAMALALLVLLGGWLWVRGEHRRLPWPVAVAVGSVFLIGISFLAWSLSRQHDFAGGSPVGVILNWWRDSVKWVIYLLERGSGQIQNVFSKMNPLLQFLFVIGYGIAQPVLPPAFFEPTTLTWHIIAVLRSAGWYVLLPLLLYSPMAAWRSGPGGERRSWLWLSGFSWAWILICAIRAGGDQWDNPRYRLIFFGWQALVAGYAWLWWRDHRDAWLPRILFLEIVCLLLYGQWYLARYNLIGIHLPIMLVLGLSLVLVVLVVAGGWLWDRRQARRARA